MKKTFLTLMLSLVAAGALMLSSCKKDDLNNNGSSSNNDNTEATIIGHWLIDNATQQDAYNLVDYTPILGYEFQLIFREDGTLLTTNGVHDSEMQYVMDGDKRVGFVQVAGMEPQWYNIIELTNKTLTLQNGEIETAQTTMYFNRVND
ncbi:MAG: hypothetical protein MJZ51_02835 [Bacteroidales bacterium]|nr:hypothetical protein [Bacteroidales bacterium]